MINYHSFKLNLNIEMIINFSCIHKFRTFCLKYGRLLLVPVKRSPSVRRTWPDLLYICCRPCLWLDMLYWNTCVLCLMRLSNFTFSKAMILLIKVNALHFMVKQGIIREFMQLILLLFFLLISSFN